MPSMSSERASWKRRASAASFRAYASSPTAVAWNFPDPATTKLPDSTWSAMSLSTGSDSPVRSDSSTWSAVVARTTPSAAIWSPVRSSTTSSSTTSSTPTSRTSRTCGALSTASWSRVRLARSSWMMPMSALLTRTMPNSASCGCPTARMTTSSTPRIALNRVKTFARTISPNVRLVRSELVFVAPCATRSWTSAAVRPVSGVSCTGSGATGCPERGGVVTIGLARVGRADQLDLAGVVVREHTEAGELGQAVAAVVGADGDELVARLQANETARPVEVAPGASDGEQVGAGLELELGLAQGPAVERGARRDRHAGDHLVAVAQGQSEHRVHLFALLDQPHHLLGGVAELLGRAAEVQQAAERRRIDLLGGAAQHPDLEALAHLVEPVLEVIHLGGEALVVQQQRRVREPDRDLGDVLHLDEHVDGAVEVGDGRVLTDVGRSPLRSAGERAQLGDAVGGAAQDEHVVGQHDLVAVGVDDPLLAAPDRDHTHAHLDGELDVGEGSPCQLRAVAHTDAVRDLLGDGEVGDERGGNAEAVGDDARHVDGGVADPLHGRDDVQHARHPLGVVRGTGGEDAHLAHLVHEALETLFEVDDLFGHGRVAEEEGGVAEVDHELGGVLRLGEHGPEVSWRFFVHQGWGLMTGPGAR